MKIADIEVGQKFQEDRFEVEVVSVDTNKFEVQYISGACCTYRQKDLDNGTIEFKSGY